TANYRPDTNKYAQRATRNSRRAGPQRPQLAAHSARPFTDTKCQCACSERNAASGINLPFEMNEQHGNRYNRENWQDWQLADGPRYSEWPFVFGHTIAQDDQPHIHREKGY